MSKHNLLEPTLLVPPHLYEVASFLLYAKGIRNIGNYTLFEYKGKRQWARQQFKTLKYLMPDGRRSLLRISGDWETFYFSTKAMEKRGYANILTEYDLPKQLKKYYRGGLG